MYRGRTFPKTREAIQHVSLIWKLAACQHQVFHGRDVVFQSAKSPGPGRRTGSSAVNPLLTWFIPRMSAGQITVWNGMLSLPRKYKCRMRSVIINAPPAFPRRCAIGQVAMRAFRPNSCARGVTLDGLKPDVNAFAVPLLHHQGDRYAPRQITCHRPWSQTHVQPLFGHGLDVRLPHRLLLLGVCLKRFLEEVKAVKQMVRFANFNAWPGSSWRLDS